MSKKQKRYRKIREQPHKVRFDDIKTFLVEELEFEMISKAGSHVIFVHDDYIDAEGRPLQIPLVRPHGKGDSFVKKVYILKLLATLDEWGILVDYGWEDD